MKSIAFLSVLGVLLLSSVVQANPPSEIIAQYDFGRQELLVTVQHIVTKTKEHYIKSIAVSKNGTLVEGRTFDFQTSHRNQTTVPFRFAAAPGDTIHIEAVCNKVGKGEKTITLIEE